MSLFHPGRWLITPAAINLVGEQKIDLLELIRRHITGDWGDCSASVKRANQAALKSGGRIWSVYKFRQSELYVITDATGDDGNRASTCIRTPEDY